MNLRLTRLAYTSTGIYSELEPYDESFTLYVAEHAYAINPPVDYHSYYLPKVPVGTWKCVRGIHRLAHMEGPFTTFEILIPDHTNILFHVGNSPQIDSDGCLLLGLEREGNKMVLHSRLAMEKFMEKQNGCNEFSLEVE